MLLVMIEFKIWIFIEFSMTKITQNSIYPNIIGLKIMKSPPLNLTR
jgi:hypothetical protein